MGIIRIVLIIILLVIIAVAGTGLYFYEYHTFKTIRICISDQAEDTNLECSTNQECLTSFFNSSEQAKELSESKGFASDLFNEVISESIYCDTTCKAKKVRGMEDLREEIPNCEPGEKEILREIKGKQGLEIIKLVRQQAKMQEAETQESKNLACQQDSDCIVYDLCDTGRCAIALHKDDKRSREELGPPNLSGTPNSQHLAAFCSEGACRLKMDCSQCDTLKNAYNDFCLENKEDYYCKTYFDCNCG